MLLLLVLGFLFYFFLSCFMFTLESSSAHFRNQSIQFVVEKTYIKEKEAANWSLFFKAHIFPIATWTLSMSWSCVLFCVCVCMCVCLHKVSYAFYFFFLLRCFPLFKRDKLTQLIKSNQMKLVNCLLTTTAKWAIHWIFNERWTNAMLLSCFINYLRKHVHSLPFIKHNKTSTANMKQNFIVFYSFRISKIFPVCSLDQLNLSGKCALSALFFFVCSFSLCCVREGWRTPDWQNVLDNNVHDFRYFFCWIYRLSIWIMNAWRMMMT